MFTWKAAYDAHLPACIEKHEGGPNDPMMKPAKPEKPPRR